MQLKNPQQIIETVRAAAEKKLSIGVWRLIALSIMAGAFVALGGTLSVVAGYGFPQAAADNPAIQKLISGATFPLGLILVVVLGAELFTGNNAVLMPAVITGHRWSSILSNWVIVWLGNFAGALIFTLLLVWGTGILAPQHYTDAIVGIAVTKTSMPWLQVFLRAIGANWCVCLALWLAFSGHSLTEKMAACWWPVMAFVVLGYEHSIANMFFIPAGMMAGAPVSISSLFVDNLIPATLGNIIGGALFVGCIYSWMHLDALKNAKK